MVSYPPNCVLLTIIPALFFIDGDPACLHTCQLAAVVGAGATHGMENAGDVCFAKALQRF